MRIHQISGPRNISTALMYSFAQRPDMQVVDEPFYGYYLASNPEVEHPGKKKVLDSLPIRYQTVIDEIIRGNYPSEHIFFKNMAHHLVGVPLDFLKDCANLFLIRHPKSLLLSLTKVIENPILRDTGLQEAHRYFDKLRAESQSIPIVIDSEKLLENPRQYLTKVCERLGIPFYSEMLSWKAGARKEDGVWAKYWYNAVHKSIGFQNRVESDLELPKALHSLYEEALEHYLHLENFSIKI